MHQKSLEDKDEAHNPEVHLLAPSTELGAEGIRHQIKHTHQAAGFKPWEEAPSGRAGPAAAPASSTAPDFQD